MELLLLPASLFIGHPLVIFAIAGWFGICSFWKPADSRGRKVLRLVTAIWVAYGIWEAYMTSGRSSFADMPFRIDLLVIAPLILASGLIGLYAVLRNEPQETGATPDSP